MKSTTLAGEESILLPNGRRSNTPKTQARPKAPGKFITIGNSKLWVRGVTYGTFRPREDGQEYPDPDTVTTDFRLMAASGFNAVRTYTVPPRWLLDIAIEHGLHVMVGLPWEQHVTFLDDRARARQIERKVRAGVEACREHPAILWYAIGNEIPHSIVRWHGRRAVEAYLERLYKTVKDVDPGALVTYVNYPTTEYLQLPFLDVVCFNVYLEQRERLRSYLARLHNLAGDRPLVLAEVGLDSRRHGEVKQAEVLDWQIRTAFLGGCAGTFVFGWTDEWHRGGFDIEDWDFGLTQRDRRPKLSLTVMQRAFSEIPPVTRRPLPRISVVVCSCNGARTIRECLDGLLRLDYPDYEVIVVNDGSTDVTGDIAAKYPFRLITTENRGLSHARNTGLKEATGEIVAYIDDDAWPDIHWLTFLAETFQTTNCAGVGGPNIPPPSDTAIAQCVANSPGGPVHVLLSDHEAEHVPGCNMAFRKVCLEAIGGFDGQFRAAGDDVDLCWRIQERGWTIGFNPAAVVWHRRRASLRGYWKQQRGYGKAEGLLERKWPAKYQALGNLTWMGRIYGKGLLQAIGLRYRIYHGTWGTALFQSLYHPTSTLWQSLPLMPEWYLVLTGLGILSLLGLAWEPLLFAIPLFLLSISITLTQAIDGARRARFTMLPPGWSRRKLCAVTTLLYLIQPLARLYGRLSIGLTPWRYRALAFPVLPKSYKMRFWSEEWNAPEKTLQMIEKLLKVGRATVRRGGDFDKWDIEVRVGGWGAARLTMGIEDHGAGKQLLCYRIKPYAAIFSLSLAGVLCCLALMAILDSRWQIGLPLAFLGGWLLLQPLVECGVAIALVQRTLRQLWPIEVR